MRVKDRDAMRAFAEPFANSLEQRVELFAFVNKVGVVPCALAVNTKSFMHLFWKRTSSRPTFINRI
jgi:hypothetical protein